MIIRKLILFATQGLHDVHRRSYKTTITNEAVNAIDEATQGGKSISQHAIAQVATNIIAPSAESEGVANIVNGWNTPRFRFMMEVEEGHVGGVTNLAYYIGHTDHSEATTRLAGNRIAIDPLLQFFVDSIHRLKSQQITVNGDMQQRQVPDQFSQVLYGRNTIANLHNGGMDEFKIRPIDVFRKQDVIHALESGGYMPQDSPIINTSGSMLMGAELSTRRNNAPGTYVFDMLNSYNQAASIRNTYGGDDHTMITEAIKMSMDSGSEVYQDPFFNIMRDFEQSITYRGQFSWGNLLSVAPYIDDVTQVITPTEKMMMRQAETYNPMYSNVWGAHNTSSWQSSDIETVAATLLANAIPTIMLENMVASIRFTMTNHSENGQVVYQLDAAHPLSERLSIVGLVNRVLERIKMELIPMVSQQNSLGFRLMVDSSVFGETAIHIAITAPEYRTYIMPTFADNSASPVLTRSQERYEQVTNDIFSLGNMLFNERPAFLHQQQAPMQPAIMASQPAVQTNIY